MSVLMNDVLHEVLCILQPKTQQQSIYKALRRIGYDRPIAIRVIQLHGLPKYTWTKYDLERAVIDVEGEKQGSILRALRDEGYTQWQAIDAVQRFDLDASQRFVDGSQRFTRHDLTVPIQVMFHSATSSGALRFDLHGKYQSYACLCAAEDQYGISTAHVPCTCDKKTTSQSSIVQVLTRLRYRRRDINYMVMVLGVPMYNWTHVDLARAFIAMECRRLYSYSPSQRQPSLRFSLWFRIRKHLASRSCFIPHITHKLRVLDRLYGYAY